MSLATRAEAFRREVLLKTCELYLLIRFIRVQNGNVWSRTGVAYSSLLSSSTGILMWLEAEVQKSSRLLEQIRLEGSEQELRELVRTIVTELGRHRVDEIIFDTVAEAWKPAYDSLGLSLDALLQRVRDEFRDTQRPPIL